MMLARSPFDARKWGRTVPASVETLVLFFGAVVTARSPYSTRIIGNNIDFPLRRLLGVGASGARHHSKHKQRNHSHVLLPVVPLKPSTEFIDNVDPGAREFEQGISRTRARFLQEPTTTQTGDGTNRDRFTVWRACRVVPDDDVGPTSPDLPVQPGHRREWPKVLSQVALYRPIIERNRVLATLVGVNFCGGTIPRPELKVSHGLKSFVRTLLRSGASVRS